MSMADEIRERVAKQKKERNSKDELANAFNNVSLTLLNRFIANVQSGTVEIDNVTDVARLFGIYKEINDIQTGEEGTGVLPSMSPTQKKLFEEHQVLVTKESENEDEPLEEYIDLEALSNMSSGDIERMLTERETEVNNENEAMS